MPFPKKLISLLAFIAAVFFIWLLVPLFPNPRAAWTFPGDEVIEPRQQKSSPNQRRPESAESSRQIPVSGKGIEHGEKRFSRPERPYFHPGNLKPAGEAYTKTVVIPHFEEDIQWLADSFHGNDNIKYVTYEVKNMTADFHPPKNKGHEVMVYLSYIIDHYGHLTDTNIFMHAHQIAWHNNDFLDWDAVESIKRLSSERVQREGYMNMRCHWDPGCPAWIHPGNMEVDLNKLEESFLARAWSDILPLDPIPKVLAQPCCGQFAVSGDRLRQLPLATYVFFRDWLLNTTLPDHLSGRIWEYLWQFIFTGRNVVCPMENTCYCDGFGICFGGEEEYQTFNKKVKQRHKLEQELDKIMEQHEQDDKFVSDNEAEKDYGLQDRIWGMTTWIDHQLQQAKINGDVPLNRAKESGRDWKEGDGF